MKNVMTNNDECAEEQLERAERSRGNWIGSRKWSFGFECHRAVLIHSFFTSDLPYTRNGFENF
jgi:hypothetical protein